jgi:hypothetical protein
LLSSISRIHARDTLCAYPSATKTALAFHQDIGAVRLGLLVAKVPNVDTNSQDTETSLNITILNLWSVKSMADLWLKYLDSAGFLEKLFMSI